MSFNSDSIELFLAVIERGSFSAAARSLGRVPSAVSMAIGHLEAALERIQSSADIERSESIVVLTNLIDRAPS